MTNAQMVTRRRLYDLAEAFYYAGVLTSRHFDAANVEAGAYLDVASAAEAAINGRDRRNYLGAPPIVNFGLAIELYIKLLRNLDGGVSMKGHDLHSLFLKLDESAPHVASEVINNHRHSRGCREDFIECIRREASVFRDWRYAHEKPFLCSSSDTLFTLADAFRKTIRTLYPDLPSSFRQSETVVERNAEARS